MKASITKKDSQTVVTIEGRLDTPNTPELEESLAPVTADPNVKDLLIDCKDLTYISSSGLRIFISLQKHFMKTGGHLTLSNLTPMVKGVFDMTGFSSIFNIV